MPSLFSNPLSDSDFDAKKTQTILEDVNSINKSINSNSEPKLIGGNQLYNIESNATFKERLRQYPWLPNFLITILAILIMFVCTMLAVEIITDEIYTDPDQSLDEIIVLGEIETPDFVTWNVRSVNYKVLNSQDSGNVLSANLLA